MKNKQNQFKNKMKTFGVCTLISIMAMLLLQFSSLSKKIVSDSNVSIKGWVIDKDSKDSIAYANVLLKDVNGKIIQSTQTNAMGFYEFKSVGAGSYKVMAENSGYNSTTANVSVHGSAAVITNISLATIENVVIDKKVEKFNTPKIEKDALSEPTMQAPSTKYKSGNVFGGYAVYDIEAMPANAYNSNFNTEEYSYISENEFKKVKDEALSTFSIDVDKASYSNIRRFINNGQTPPQDAVRIEEMVNYFTYDYPQPTGVDPFSISTEVANCPWNSNHRLVQIGLQGKKIKTDKLPASNLVFLIDVSGSMEEPNKLPLVKQSLRLLVNELREQDRVALVVYAGAAGLVLESTAGDKKEKILEAIDNLNAGGSTAGGAGINLAYKIAKENLKENGNNRIILATDGDFNVGASSDGELVRLIEEKRETGIFLTVLGYGMGNYKDSKMEQLADKGNGNYSYIDNIMEAKKTLVTEMGGTLLTIAKDVKIQVEFNPAKVSSYKLIGYENRLLNKEDFNDDKKDAGELGSGHTVTALYEIVLAGTENSNSTVDPLRYQQVNEEHVNVSASDELLTVKFRYKEPKGTESKLIVKYLKDENEKLEEASNNLKFSAAVAEFGLLLRNSKFKADANYDNVISLAKLGKGVDEEGYRSEFIRLVEQYELQAKK